MSQIRYIGHATVLIDIGDIRILTDPLLRDRVFFLRRNGPNTASDILAQRPPDVVLLSHLHYDHADLPSLRQLPSTTTVLAPRGSGRFLSRSAGVNVCEVQAGDTVHLADVEITALPANHGPARNLPRPLPPCLSYVMKNHVSVYFAGDTDLFDYMNQVGEDHALDLALLPVWGYSPHVGSGHLTPKTAAQALSRLKPRIAVPIHWGSLRFLGPSTWWKNAPYLIEPPHVFAQHASHWHPQTEVRVLQPGQSTTVN